MAINQGRPVLYVEPNWINSIDDGNGGMVPMIIPPEDYCMYVDLKVEVYSRGMAATSGAKTMVVEWVSTSDEDAVRFMSGSRIYTDPSKEKFFNSLTTNYTNTYLGDIIEGKQTNELFGIDSINVKYNQFFVPEVTIQFTDIRGAALFGVSQLAHLKRVNNISGFRDDDIADSFFSCFFTFPYPKFTLMFKGFYGRPVTYSLTCSSFNTKFDSETGCFKATATFIGYSYSFLGDVSFSAILSSPYSDGGGKEYWKRRVEYINDDFFLFGENGERRKIPTMGEVLVALDNIEEKINEATAGSEAIQKQTELDDKKNKTERLLELNAQYMASFTGESNYVVVEGLEGDLVLLVKDAPDEGKEWVLNEDIAKAAQERYDILVKAAKESGIEPPFADSFEFKNARSIRVFNAWEGKPKELSKTILAKVESWKRDPAKFKEAFMERCRAIPEILGTNTTVTARAGNTATGETMVVVDASNNTLNYNHGFYVYNWNSALKEMVNGKVSEVNQEIAENNEKVAEAEAQALTKILGFAPTVYNMCKLIMSHVEVFVWLMYDTVKRIYDNKESRTPEALNFQNAEILSDFKVSETNFVPPFPQVTSQITSDGVPSQENYNMDGMEDSNTRTIEHADGSRTTIEEDWIGKIGGNFEEQKLVEGLLNGAKEIGELMMKHAEAMNGGTPPEEGNTSSSSTMAGISGRECAVPNPVCALDMVLMNKDYGPWGKIDFKRYDDFAGKVFMRMEQCLKYSTDLNRCNAAKIAEGDVINFKSKFSTVDGIVGEKILGSHDFDEFTQIITGKKEEYKKDGVYAWECSSKESYGIAKKSGDRYQFNAFRTKDNEAIMPTEGRPFTNINGDLRPDNGTPPTFNIPISYSNYGFFNDVSVPDDGKATNQNVFKIDVSGYADYVEYYKSSTIKMDSFNTSFDFSSYISLFDLDWIDDFFYDGLELSTLSSIGETGRMKRMPSSVGTSKDGSLFGEKGYYDKTSTFEKGYLFLKACHKFLKSRQFDGNQFVSAVNVAQTVIFIPRVSVLSAGAILYLAKNGGDSGIKMVADAITKNFRKEVIDGLIGHYISWVANEFKQIDSTYTIGRTANFNKIDGDIDDDEILLCISNPESLKEIYVMDDDIDYSKTTQSLELIFSESANTKPIIAAIFQPCALVFPCVNRHKGKIYDDTIPAGIMKTYWDTFTEGLKEIATGSNASDASGTTEGSTSTIDGAANSTAPEDVTTLTTPATSEAPEDIKVAMYHYCKIFFDKWVAGADLDKLLSDWSLGSFFDPLDPRNGRFHFIDSFYNEIGNRVLVNPQILYEDIAACQTQNGFNLMTVFSDLFSKNRFTFFCLENFKDLMDYDNYQDMFKPLPYNSMGKDDIISDFVAIYSYEPSSRLDIEDGTYPGDGFMLNNEELYPYAIKHKDMNYDYPIPAFGVTYGMQNQSYFNSIEVSMEKPMATEQSLKSQYLLAGTATDKTLVREYVPYGQDLFSIYSNNMYQCTVKMMGCAHIQPLMYFCLTNVPLFRGAYLISKVEHSITPGNIETTFTGTRMAATASRIATNWVHKGYAPEAFYQEHAFNAYGGGGGTAGGYGSGGGYTSASGTFEGSGVIGGIDARLAHDESTLLMLIERTIKTDTYTEGHMYKVETDGTLTYMCDTIEDKDYGWSQSTPVSEIRQVKASHPKQTAIPTGRFKLDPKHVTGRQSLKEQSYKIGTNGRLPEIMGLPGFGGVLIHGGSSERSSAGCVIVGTKDNDGHVKDWVAALTKVVKDTIIAAGDAGKNCEIVIRTGKEDVGPSQNGTSVTDEYDAKFRQMGFINLEKIDGILVDLKYKSTDNFAKEDMYSKLGLTKAFYHPSNVDYLQKALVLLQKQKFYKNDGTEYPKGTKFGFIIYDTVRPVKVQKRFEEVATKMGKSNWIGRFIARPGHSNHGFGSAVDLGVVAFVNNSWQKVGFGSDFDGFRFGEASEAKCAMAYYDNATSKEGKVYSNNRKSLVKAMTGTGGFSTIKSEWWHFDCKGWKSSKQID